MQVHIKATNTSLTPAVSDYIEKKVTSLEKFIEKEDTTADLQVEVGRTTEHHKQGDIFRAEFNLKTRQGTFYAVSERRDIYTALDEVKDELIDALRAKKGKRLKVLRRGQLKIKELIRGFYQ